MIRKSKLLETLAGPLVIVVKIFLFIKEGLKIIKKRNVEILLGISDGGPALISTYFLSKISKKPYFLLFFDLYKDNDLRLPEKILAKIFEPILFKNAQKIILTNGGTKDFYQQRYGQLPYEVIHNSVFFEEYEHYRTPYQPKPPYKIIFTGNIYWAQRRSLENLIKALGEINDFDIRLEIYTPNFSDSELLDGINGQKISLKSAPQSKMPEIQTSADILFLPLSWHAPSEDIINTATPGKLSDYLASGRPILIHAPASSFLVKYARKNNFAAIVDEENIEKLKAAIKRLIKDIPYSQKLITNAYQTFIKNHEANKNAQKFLSLFKK